jgi:hypothetical protein
MQDQPHFPWQMAVNTSAWIIGILLFVTGSYGYIRVEFNTRLHQDDLQAQERCENEKPNGLKSVKVFEYERFRDYASILCVYEDSDENLLISFNYRNNEWERINVKKINEERFYWPIYL